MRDEWLPLFSASLDTGHVPRARLGVIALAALFSLSSLWLTFLLPTAGARLSLSVLNSFLFLALRATTKPRVEAVPQAHNGATAAGLWAHSASFLFF